MQSVLVVDDNAGVRQLVAIALERCGREVVAAADGLEAARLIRSRPFDAMVTDIDMPRRSGLEVIADLRRISPETRVVIMCGDWQIGGTDLRQLAAALGVRAFVGKPFSLQELLAALESDESLPDPLATVVSPAGMAAIA